MYVHWLLSERFTQIYPGSRDILLILQTSERRRRMIMFVLILTCVSLIVAAQGSLRRSMTPVFSAVSMSGSLPLLRYGIMLHVVIICPSFVSVATPRPAVPQGRGRPFHGTAVTDGLRRNKKTNARWRRNTIATLQNYNKNKENELFSLVQFIGQDSAKKLICRDYFGLKLGNFSRYPVFRLNKTSLKKKEPNSPF